jgi:hypothetical protein
MRSGATESALGGTAKVSSAGRVADSEAEGIVEAERGIDDNEAVERAG